MNSQPPSPSSAPRGPNTRRLTAAQRRWREQQRPQSPGIRRTLYDVIFEADTAAGRGFDIGLLVAILISVTIVSLETVPQYAANASLMQAFYISEGLLTLLFTVEYLLRLACTRRPLRYAISFWGLVDLLSILPSYVMVFTTNSPRSFAIIRSVRLLRVFRVLKLWRMMNEAEELSAAVWSSRGKIIVFLSVVLVAVTISGTLMYAVETIAYADGDIDSNSQFTSIPQSMYWAIVTMTTVGYGDVVPTTLPGKMLSAALILLGYSLIIVPTGFVSAELAGKARAREREHSDALSCPRCESPNQSADAVYCYRCGERLDS